MEQLPVILEYFIPGFIFLKLFYFFTSRKSGEYMLITSVVTSCIIRAICSVFHSFILPALSFRFNVRIITLVLVAAILSFSFAIISELPIINRFLVFITGKSIHDDIWRDIIDYKNGTTLRVICDSAIYTGILDGHEENGLESWFILTDYIVEENGTTFEPGADFKYATKLAVNLRDVKRIEVYTSKQTQK